MLAYSFQEKNPPYLLLFETFYRQASPKFVYSFIDFKEIIPVGSFILAYSFIRDLRVIETVYCSLPDANLIKISEI